MANRAAAEPFPALNIDRVIDPKIRRFQVLAGGDGLSIFLPHPRFWLRNFLRTAHRAAAKMRVAFSPVPLPIVWGVQAATATVLLTSKSTSAARNMWVSNALWDLDCRLPLSKFCSTQVRVGYLSLAASGVFMVGFTATHRALLKMLLSYTRWMEEGRGKRSLATVVWGALLKYVYMRRNLTPTFSLQNCLPRQPVPGLKDTIARYLESMQPLLSNEEYTAVAADAERFIKAEGPGLQRYLKFKYWTSTNYVSDWWLSVVYLRGRESIMINSNYYGLSLYRKPPTSNQAARAATFTRYMLEVRALIDREELPRLMIQDIVPICMQQYAGAFNMTREPGHEEDRLVQYDSAVSRHIVVMCGGRFFKVNCYCHRTGRLLSRLQLEAAFNGILDAVRKDEASPREALLGALTALPRTEWATLRDDLFKRDKINRLALQTIERAAIVVCLDAGNAPHTEIETCGRMGLHGNGADRWFDKSCCLVVSADANVMINGEHAWADAPTLGHIFELSMAFEARGHAKGTEYAEDGSVLPTAGEMEALKTGTLTLYRPERIVFNVGEKLLDASKHAHGEARKQIDNLDLSCIRFDVFGKGVIKKAKVSPDAFIQMALQLAYFRDQGHFTQTYESGMARLYREGRTETIRSASNEAAAFARAMVAGDKSPEELKALLNAACNKHVRTSTLAMTGKGVDRHLFALYVVAVGTQTDSTFLSTAMKRGWKLSTSQIPQHIPDFVNKNDWGDFERPAGGFGPVAKDGYGVCYTITGENSIFFHVTANRDSDKTDAKRMRDRITQAMQDIRAVAGV
eukprot:CAMPEP_0174844160 /NCGR_PEP_ID=MMETSP1114-20130205/10935_1 /TAXON_ID=312471 /ORGANISM="Neobodo designis, Strain CCAP 1951/1" /LENGTH=799 /DNA_ID=CAMNT_0016078393 /DNA_START=55 /DNA_END=2454 /DNA_ORIENTATION=+